MVKEGLRVMAGEEFRKELRQYGNIYKPLALLNASSTGT